jgi:hypothetical protein
MSFIWTNEQTFATEAADAVIASIFGQTVADEMEFESEEVFTPLEETADEITAW